MNDLSNFIGGCLFGGIFVGIVVLALATAYWLYVRKDQLLFKESIWG